MPRLLRRWGIFTAVALLIIIAFSPSTSFSIWAILFGRGGLERLPVQYGPPRDSFLKWRMILEHFPVLPWNLTRLPQEPPERIPRIQHDFTVYHEPESRKAERERRLERVREAFQHSWDGYRKHAWLSDELKPISGGADNPFGGWGATLIDSLDALWIMGLEYDFAVAVATLKQIDFTRCKMDEISLFETSIRYLGGLLGAYDISGGRYPILLHKAIELGEMLYHAFDTENRMPVLRWNWRVAEAGDRNQTAPNFSMAADLGSLTLEFTRLAQLTTDHRYFDAVQRISDLFAAQQNNTKLPGLWPLHVDPQNQDLRRDTTFTFGGGADSLYEYLPKQYLLLGGRLDMYRDMYMTAMASAKEYLAFEPLIPLQDPKAGTARIHRRDPYSFSPDYINPIILGTVTVSSTNPSRQSIQHKPEGQHLSCFAGGMTALASRTFSRFQSSSRQEEDLTLARRLTAGCVWSYRATGTGIGPEIFYTHPCRRGRAAITSGAEPDWIGRGKGDSCRWDRDTWVQAVREQQLQNNGVDAGTNARLESEDPDRWEHVIQEMRLGQGSIEGGFTEVPDPRYMLRPETIESLFVLWRVTGDPKFQDQAWVMFESIVNITRTQVGFASLRDVTQNPLRERSMHTSDGEPGVGEKGKDEGSDEDSSSPSGKHSGRHVSINKKKEWNRPLKRWTDKAQVLIPKRWNNEQKPLANQEPDRFFDKMESFWTAETLKYFYLIFSEPDVLSLDEFVLNTEAHPFRWRVENEIPGGIGVRKKPPEELARLRKEQLKKDRQRQKKTSGLFVKDLDAEEPRHWWNDGVLW